MCVSRSLPDGATITSVSENIVVNPGEEAMLSCSVEGKPLTEDHVRWERLGYEIVAPKAVVTFANGTSFLHVKDAQRGDVGNFRCFADNRVANPTSRDVLLIVKCECWIECVRRLRWCVVYFTVNICIQLRTVLAYVRFCFYIYKYFYSLISNQFRSNILILLKP